jgi:hypothetical protein
MTDKDREAFWTTAGIVSAVLFGLAILAISLFWSSRMAPAAEQVQQMITKEGYHATYRSAQFRGSASVFG